MIYMWNGFTFPPFYSSVGVEQESALSSIIPTIYMAPIIKMFKKE